MKKNLFIVLCSLLLCMAGCQKKTETTQSNVETIHKTKVSCQKLQPHHFQEIIHSQGTIQAIKRASMSAKVSGTLDILQIDDGDFVKKGDVLFQTDKTTLENKVMLAEQDLKVAEDTKLTAEADLEIAETQLSKARSDFQRNKQLFDAKTISIDTYESAQVAMKNAYASKRKCDALVRYNQTKIKQTEVSLEIAKKNLRDSIVLAPFDAVVIAKYKEEKEYVSAGTLIVSLENHEELEISTIISAVYHDRISHDTPFEIYFNNQHICQAKPRYISSSIQPASRTFEIQANLPKNTKIVSGTLCEIDIILEEHDGMGLPRNSVLVRQGGKYVAYEVVNGKAKSVTVEVGIISGGFAEIKNAKALKDKNFITAGQYFIHDGSPVEVVKGE